MAYEPHIRVTAGGGLGTNSPPPEEWSCTLNFDLGSGMIVQSNVDLMWAAWVNLIHTAYFSVGARLAYVKASEIDASGHVVGTVLRHDGASAGTGDGVQYPFQVAMAVSLRTGERGASKRGRFYLPVPNIQVQSTDGLFSTSSRTDRETDITAFLNSMNTAAGEGRPLVVASSKGYNTPVTGYNVGRALDTQRRRRRSLDESYDTPIALA